MVAMIGLRSSAKPPPPTGGRMRRKRFRYGFVTSWMKPITALRIGLYGMRGIQLSRIRTKIRIR